MNNPVKNTTAVKMKQVWVPKGTIANPAGPKMTWVPKVKLVT